MTIPRRLKILYLVHDLCDPSVARRIAMLRDGGAQVVVAGFRRDAEPVNNVTGCMAVDFGQTFNGKFAQRMWSVTQEMRAIKDQQALYAGADIIIARNLEMLAIAVKGREVATEETLIVYECLDIHRLLLGNTLPSKSLRWLEGRLAEKASALITSSPAFISSYFNTLSHVKLPTMLVENKVYNPRQSATPPGGTPRPPGPPWKIGWFGAIRCRKSLEILAELVKQGNGTVQVVIRGRPALDQFDDFHATVEQTPGMQFLGPYKNPGDLAAIYRDVHFTWAIDMFEEGLNSSWLLPNRLYEGGLHCSVPIAESAVETGRFLKNLGIGVVIPEPKSVFLSEFFATLTPQHYEQMERDAARISRAAWLYSPQDCREMVNYLASLHSQWTQSSQPINVPTRQADMAIVP